MKRIILLISILAAVSALADDDGERVGCWNITSIDDALILEGSFQGMIFEYAGPPGQDADSAAWYMLVNGPNHFVKIALYRLWPGTQWLFSDSTNWIDLVAAGDTVWYGGFIFQEGYTMVPDSDSLYCLVAWGEATGGDLSAYSIDSTGADGRRQALGGLDYSTTAWWTVLGGNTVFPNTIPIAYLKYAVAAPSGYVQPIIIEE